MEPTATSITPGKSDRHLWAEWAALSIVPVLLIMHLCSNHERAWVLLGLFLVEWIVVLVAWRLLCPWLGRRSVAFAAAQFLLTVVVAAILTRENMKIHNAVWTWSDDWWYLNEAGGVVDTLRLTGWNLLKAWRELISHWEGAAWTLAGWPFVLGVVGSLVTSDASPEMLHAISLSLNATFLSLVLALFLYVVNEPARRFPGMAFACFLLLIGDPIVYAGQCLKESMLQLCLMLAFVLCMKLSERVKARWVLLGLLGLAGVATTRPGYVPLIMLVLYWTMLDKIRLSGFLKVMFGLIIAVLFGGAVLGFNIREFTIGELISGRTLVAEAGPALYIYNIPVIGPVLYYAISPIPPMPWNVLSGPTPILTMIRGIGSAMWFVTASFVLLRLLSDRRLLKNRLFMAAAIMFSGLFMAAVLIGDDPRYKQPANFYLAIMLFLIWYHGRMRRTTPRDEDVGALKEQEQP